MQNVSTVTGDPFPLNSFTFFPAVTQVNNTNDHEYIFSAVTRLMDHWSETNNAVSGRLQALQECLHDSINWQCQFEHIQVSQSRSF